MSVQIFFIILVISQDIYQEFFIDSFIQSVLERYETKLFVFHVQKQEIVLWRN